MLSGTLRGCGEQHHGGNLRRRPRGVAAHSLAGLHARRASRADSFLAVGGRRAALDVRKRACASPSLPPCLPTPPRISPSLELDAEAGGPCRLPPPPAGCHCLALITQLEEAPPPGGCRVWYRRVAASRASARAALQRAPSPDQDDEQAPGGGRATRELTRRHSTASAARAHARHTLRRHSARGRAPARSPCEHALGWQLYVAGAIAALRRADSRFARRGDSKVPARS